MSRKIDALVAEYVMGLENVRWENYCMKDQLFYGGPWIDDYGCDGYQGTSKVPGREVPFYSRDISAAWEVVEKIKGEQLILEWSDIGGDDVDGPHWDCAIFPIDEKSITVEQGGWCSGEHETAPMAIAIAALKAKGVDVKALEEE